MKLLSDNAKQYILEWEKEYLYEALTLSMVSVLRLVEDKIKEKIGVMMNV